MTYRIEAIDGHGHILETTTTTEARIADLEYARMRRLPKTYAVDVRYNETPLHGIACGLKYIYVDGKYLLGGWPVKIHPSINLDRVEAATREEMFGLENPGFCIACGEDADGCEPDARRYECEFCGERQVYGAAELFMMMV